MPAGFVRGLEGTMRLRSNNLPPPPGAEGFRSPIPPPPPTGGGKTLLKLLKYGAGIPGLLISVLADFFIGAKPVSDGTIPHWITDVNNEETLEDASYLFTGGQSPGVKYKLTVILDFRPRGTNDRVTRDYGLFPVGVEGAITSATYAGEGGQYLTVNVIFNSGTDSTSSVINTGSGNYIYFGSVKLKFVRVDSEPDTGGNIAPIEDAIFTARTPQPQPEPEPSPEPELDKEPQPNGFPWRDFSPQPIYVPYRVPGIPQPDKLGDTNPESTPEPTPNPPPSPIPTPPPEPVPDPKPDKKWSKITNFLPIPPGIGAPTLDGNPKPTAPPSSNPPPPPNQTPVDKCAGSCSSKGGGGNSFAPGDPSTVNFLSLMNDLLLQNPLLKKIDATTTTTMKAATHKDYGLQKIQQFADIAWKATHADKILNGITTALVIHNAVMLSGNLAQTIGEAASSVLNAIGIKDSEGEPFDVNAVIKAKMTELITSVIGAATYKELTQKIAAANRIYQSSANVLDITRSLFDSARNVAELTAENTGKIGNALRESGAVYEDAYELMQEKVNPQNQAQRRLEGLSNTLGNIEEGVSAISEISSEVVETTENIEQLKAERKQLEDETKLFLDAEKIKKEDVKTESQAETELAKLDFARDETDG